MDSSTSSGDRIRDKRLVKSLNRKGITTDLHNFLDEDGQVFISMLINLSTFAKKYSIMERGVIRHILAGDIPCVIIADIPFIIDMGEASLIASKGWELTEGSIEILHNLLNQRLSKVSRSSNNRRTKSGHLRAEFRKDFIKTEGARDRDYLNIGFKK
jgi:hypothetical protein